MNGNDPLIILEGVTKVFYTDEVETHALSGVHLEIETNKPIFLLLSFVDLEWSLPGAL